MALDKFSRLGPRLLSGNPIDLQSACGLQSVGESVQKMILVSAFYRELLLEYRGAVVFDNGAKFFCDERSPLNDKHGYQGLEILFGLGKDKNSIEEKIAQYSGELPASFIPIGESAGGNLICVDDNGSVNLWDHESLVNDRPWRIAASVDEFLKRLEPDDSSISGTLEVIETESFLDF